MDPFGSSYTPPSSAPGRPPGFTPSQPTTASGSPHSTDIAALQSTIDSLQAELRATNRVNTHLASTVACLQAEQASPTLITIASTSPALPPTTAATATKTPTLTITTTTTWTPGETARTTTTTTPAPPSTTSSTANTSPPSPPHSTAPTTWPPSSPNTINTTTSTTSAQVPCSHPDHPGTIASGRGAASPEVFQQIIKTNWHGRLGRTHMVEVDNLPASALTELDCLLRRKLHTVFPRGGAYAEPDADKIFASLAALGLRLEDRGAYADLPVQGDDTIQNEATLKRAKNFAMYYHTRDDSSVYWRGSVLETMAELARYRGLFDEKDFLKRE